MGICAPVTVIRVIRNSGILAAALAQQIEIETIIFVAEERLHPPIAAQRHVTRQIRDDETGDAGHWRG
ncbi:MAG: hypothetical protein ABSF67_20990 [Roseiarcus sp.]